jgi:DnaJ-class molecular chaperone
MTHKLYDELGIPRTASLDEIKKAYRRAAREHHPDKGGNEEKFKNITNAYEILTDEGKRNQYDQLGDENYQQAANGGGGGGGGFPGGMNAHDIFAQMFGGMAGGGFPGNMHFDFGQGGGGGRQQRRRQDHNHGMHINLQEAYHGVHKTLQVNLQKVCLKCKEACPSCQGRGQITNMVRQGPFTQIINQPCVACQMTGFIIRGRDTCSECKGCGNYTEEKRIEIDIASGVLSGKQIRMEGLGEQRQTHDEISGDLILEIKINDHAFFTREGNDLKYAKRITFKESIIGIKFTIDHFSGPIEIDTRDYGIIQVAKKYEVRGKGMPIDGNRGRCGNLIIQFDITYPQKPLDSDVLGTLESALNAVNL